MSVRWQFILSFRACSVGPSPHVLAATFLALDQVDEVGGLTGGGTPHAVCSFYPEVLLVNLSVAIHVLHPRGVGLASGSPARLIPWEGFGWLSQLFSSGKEVT